MRVNSSHHQSVKDVAPSLQASALAPDGIIEAIESSAQRFLLGIQWHPEFLFDRHDRPSPAVRGLPRRRAAPATLMSHTFHEPPVACYT